MKVRVRVRVGWAMRLKVKFGLHAWRPIMVVVSENCEWAANGCDVGPVADTLLCTLCVTLVIMLHMCNAAQA